MCDWTGGVYVSSVPRCELPAQDGVLVLLWGPVRKHSIFSLICIINIPQGPDSI